MAGKIATWNGWTGSFEAWAREIDMVADQAGETLFDDEEIP